MNLIYSINRCKLKSYPMHFNSYYELCKHTAIQLRNNRKILYEQSDELSEIIYKYNELGFLTYTSQPGLEYNNPVYQSPIHRYQKCKISIATAIRKQRAFVRGFMKRDMAKKVYTVLHEDKNLRIRTEDNNDNFELDVRWGSINFINDEAMNSEEDADCSFNLGLPLRKPFKLLYEDIIIPDDDIVEVEIFDVRWNNNEELWTRLLELLQSFNQK